MHPPITGMKIELPTHFKKYSKLSLDYCEAPMNMCTVSYFNVLYKLSDTQLQIQLFQMQVKEDITKRLK